MTYEAETVEKYLFAIPAERRAPFSALRSTITKCIPAGFEETIQYNMPSWVVPHSRYPAGYHCNPVDPLPFISIASQKNFFGFYHLGIYDNPDLLAWFQKEYAALGIGKLDMGKSCIRLKNMDRIPYSLLGELVSKISVDEWIAVYEKAIKK
jgi:uncharacterized protein YdhG (YjbR/CyaY superfamily)